MCIDTDKFKRMKEKITQIFEDEPTVIEIKNQNIADAYMRFFEELWESSSDYK